LRARGVLFVEGDDLVTLRHVARTLDAEELIRETSLVIVPLQGFSNWEHVEPFSWLLKHLLEDSVRVLVVLDRDYRYQRQVSGVIRRLRVVGVGCHVWQRKELESYFLEPSAISRVSGAPTSDVKDALTGCAETQRTAVFARQLAERIATEVSAKNHQVSITEAHQRRFDKAWGSVETRWHMCNAKELLSDLNKWLAGQTYKPVGIDQLARQMRQSEIPDEMIQVIRLAEDLVGSDS
jgi:hypothetical protein